VLSSLPERSLVRAFFGEARLNFLFAAIAESRVGKLAQPPFKPTTTLCC
jgi:hypothetical protein